MVLPYPADDDSVGQLVPIETFTETFIEPCPVLLSRLTPTAPPGQHLMAYWTGLHGGFQEGFHTTPLSPREGHMAIYGYIAWSDDHIWVCYMVMHTAPLPPRRAMCTCGEG